MENPGSRRRRSRREPRRPDRALRNHRNIKRRLQLLHRRNTRQHHRPRRNIRWHRRRLSVQLHRRRRSLNGRPRHPLRSHRVRLPHPHLRHRPQHRSRKEAGSWSAKRWPRRRRGRASLPRHQCPRRAQLLPNASRARLHPIPHPSRHLAEVVPRQRPLAHRWRAVRRRPSPHRFQWSRGQRKP
jgi:hypothetical protein